MRTVLATTPLTNGRDFSDQELMRALYDIDDILGRALCPYLLLGQTAKSLTDGMTLSGDGIYIGVLKKYLTKSVLSTIKFYLDHSKKVEIGEDGFEYEWGGVPVHVTFIKRNYKFFKYPDHKFYMASEYRIPNPFDVYWKARTLVK